MSTRSRKFKRGDRVEAAGCGLREPFQGTITTILDFVSEGTRHLRYHVMDDEYHEYGRDEHELTLIKGI